MYLFKKTLGLMAVLCVMPTAFGATARGTINADTARISMSRMPTMSVKITDGTSTTATGTTTSAALLADKDCIDSYNDCIKGADVCGENFEECTTRVLFHGKMPNCLSTLAQCSSTGVNSLFGTSNISALSNIASKNTYGEVTDYTYPTDGSVLGQMITAAAISNQYDTSTCVRRYTSCLKKESVCGADFELCTTDKEFRKQRVFCDSTLARCQGEGVTELLGSSTRTAVPSKTSRVGEMIAEGAALAAVNAVSTCYKSVDQCILNACAENPYRCSESSTTLVAELADAIKNGEEVADAKIEEIVNKSGDINKASIAAYIKNSCFDTIGSSKYCYATFIGNGQMPTNAQLRDEDNQEEIYDEAYAARMNASMRAKIVDLVNKFDTKAKAKCTETIKACAMRTCGGGVGSACYAAVNTSADNSKSINGSATYGEIKTGCESIINTDTNCKYAAANPNSTGTYSYSYINRDAFTTLFPEFGEGKDPIGVVASLNSSLATSYNDAAIANMKKQCANIARGCVVSMCGADYTNCYRNRTDVVSGTYNTGTDIDRSMNKMGGVLDNNIVIGLCLDTVKNASVCEEHLAIEANKIKLNSEYKSSWGDTASVRDGWLDANTTSAKLLKPEVIETGYCTASNVKSNPKCNEYTQDTCGTVDTDGCVYDVPVTETFNEYALSTSAKTVLQEVVADVEKEAQAKYNAKLTKEQNMCMASNNGGILGTKDLGSTFMWVKLKSNKVPRDYTVKGLSTSQFVASNDLYGSFCRVRVTLQSDDKKIQEAMKGKTWTTAYFATGDSFACGSWIPEKDLDELANAVAQKATEGMAADQKRARTWATVLAGLGGAAGGYVWGDNIRSGKSLTGLTGLDEDSQKNKRAQNILKCQRDADLVNKVDISTDSVHSYAKALRNDAQALQIISADVENLKEAVRNYSTIYAPDCNAQGLTSDQKNTCNTAKAGWLSSVRTTAGNIKAECEKLNAEDANTKNRGWINVVSSITMGGAGALLVNRATRDLQDSELDAAQRAAYEEWMNNVGRHITCYIGGDEAGNYGDIITTSLE